MGLQPASDSGEVHRLSFNARRFGRRLPAPRSLYGRARLPLDKDFEVTAEVTGRPAERLVVA